MKKCVILALVLCLLLAACGGEELIGEAKAIDIAFAQVGEYTSASILRGSAVCRLVPGNNGYTYKVAFGDLVFVIDAVSGDILSVAQSA